MQTGISGGDTKKRRKKKIKHAVQYLLKKYIVESMNIALIVHFTPHTLREARGGGRVVSSSEMAGGKNKIKVKRATHPTAGMREEREKTAGVGRCVC